MLQGDISKLPERGHFYFAPTIMITKKISSAALHDVAECLALNSKE